nr:hypothetical protein [Tanacetum cinerariifolium]
HQSAGATRGWPGAALGTAAGKSAGRRSAAGRAALVALPGSGHRAGCLAPPPCWQTGPLGSLFPCRRGAGLRW